MSDTGLRPGRPRDPEVDSAILSAAAAILSELGFGGLTMELVAERAGVSKASVYRRFANREELLEAACSEFAPALPEPPDSGDTSDDLVALLRVMAQGLAEPVDGAPLPAILAAAASNPEARAALKRFSDTRRKPVTEVLERARARNELPDESDPRYVDDEAIAEMLAGAVLFRSLVRGQPVDEDRLRRYVAVIGLTP